MSQYFLTRYSEWKIKPPALHCVLGSGIGAALNNFGLSKGWRSVGEISFGKVPGLSPATVPEHAGVYRYYEWSGGSAPVSLCLQVGRLHGYEGLTPREVVSTVLLPFEAGTQNFILTNAAGALTRKFKVGSVMLITDHVNLTGQNPLTGKNLGGPRFPDMKGAYDPSFSKLLEKALQSQKLKPNHGIYLGLPGPSFETPAEIRLFARWGLQAVGMSTVWECIALKHRGARVAGLSLISNWGSGLSKEVLSHEDVVRASKISAHPILKAFFKLAETQLKNHISNFSK